jgi:hypothetical protein
LSKQHRRYDRGRVGLNLTAITNPKMGGLIGTRNRIHSIIFWLYPAVIKSQRILQKHRSICRQVRPARPERPKSRHCLDAVFIDRRILFACPLAQYRLQGLLTICLRRGRQDFSE